MISIIVPCYNEEKTIETFYNAITKEMDNLKEEFEVKLENLKAELADLDKEKVLEIAKKKAVDLKEKAQDLVELAIEKGTPILRDMAEEVRLKTIDVTKEVLKKLENADKK